MTKHIVSVKQNIELTPDELSRVVHRATLDALGDYRLVGDDKLMKLEQVSRNREEWREVPISSINPYHFIQIKAAMSVRTAIDIVLGIASHEGM